MMATPKPPRMLGRFIFTAVLTQTGTRNTLQALDDRAAFIIFQCDFKLGSGFFADNAEVTDVTFGF